MNKRKICVVTGTRAEYGLLYWLMKYIDEAPEFTLQIIATGMHLSPEFGLTYKQIEKDSFTIDEKVEMLLSSDTPVGIAKSIGLATIGFADALERLKPDLLVILGDRYEMLAVAQAALVARIPIAHIAGGDVTEGAFDEAIRHSITKMSHIHFVTNEQSRQRVRQLGENGDFIFNVGSPGIDQIKKIDLLSRGEVGKRINFTFRQKNLLITFHPVTLEQKPAVDQFKELLDALDSLGPDVGLIFTNPNSDNESRQLIKLLDEFVRERENAASYTSLGQLLYLNTINQVDAVVGNSSSGVYEVPSFKKPTVNIGSRQRGRLYASSVINCETNAESIKAALKTAFSMDCEDTVNPYGDGTSSIQIVEHLKSISDYKKLLMKKFYEVGI
ncbi:UDP-N-acetyl-D-glucosamine 2-epimerase, UDP-hydrolysing [Bacillus sp. FJAT-27225]|uniref:UDP-N-acetylglucosamine 2-epimerase n=1 Tax=Bacillus sp. FJAT-27225 TaxID=1743144 RepID=UPI00080C30F3|nr:UDP-N-acetylglucosamine 2-epimerase [Bacillus sp. FJAT-27225]OCA87870.1 UDP-N-acetyl-D-glucosamine 2-epimerase, UDP-hydrolysing [Bacillus sp. FJAT-27225]